jgi:hypothetical protein
VLCDGISGLDIEDESDAVYTGVTQRENDLKKAVL